jgi:hypothetical protein
VGAAKGITKVSAMQIASSGAAIFCFDNWRRSACVWIDSSRHDDSPMMVGATLLFAVAP